MELLRNEGFKCFEPGRLTLKEQIQLFANVDLIVGPHGLAFTNLLYSQDAKVIELFPEGGATELYFLLANECDLQYEFMICDSVDKSNNTRPRDKDLVVDIEALKKIIEGQ
jgi:capsular polysaccharide biosynthesis protein